MNTTNTQVFDRKEADKESGKKLWKLSVIMFLFTLLLTLLIGLLIVESQKCNLTVEEADLCGKHISFFGDSDVFIPLSEEDLDIHCRIMVDNIKCLRSFGRGCLPGFPRQALSIFTFDVQQVMRKRCRRPEMRKEFLEFAKCWSPKEKLHETKLCIDKHIIQLEYISKNIAPESQIAAICCTFHQRHDCIEKQISKICDERNANYVMQTIDGSVKDIQEFTCGVFRTTDDCNRLFDATVWQPLKDLVNTTDETLLASRHKHKSSLAPIIAIITHFDM